MTSFTCCCVHCCRGKRTFFMVNTVALVGQQAAYIRRHSRHSVGEYSGDMNVDFWDKDKWQEELSKNQVGCTDVAMSEDSVLLGCDNVLYVPFLIFGSSYCQTMNVNLGLHATVSRRAQGLAQPHLWLSGTETHVSQLDVADVAITSR